MSPRAAAALCAACLIIQPTLAGLFSPAGKAPDLLLCVTVTASLSARDGRWALLPALIAAGLQDVCFSLYPGPGAAAVFLAGVCALAAAGYFSWDRLPFFMAFTVFETVIYHLVLWAGAVFLGASRSFFHLLRLLPVAAALNLAVMAGIYCGFIRKNRGKEL